MKRLHRLLLRMLPGPFFGWLGMLMFLLLMQFLIRYLPDIVGKGLPVGVVVELVAYNLAYMVVLAVPMSALIATLMAFGRLAESNTYVVVKSSGISLMRFMWPALAVGFALFLAMMFFNNEVLPEANFRAKNLWQDIRRKKPGFELQPGVFYDGLSGYSILVNQIPPPLEGEDAADLVDVTIYDHTEGSQRIAAIKARRGRIEPQDESLAIDLLLEDGELVRRIPPTAGRAPDRLERLAFERYRLRLDLSDFAFERSDPREGYRSDRTMPTLDMIRYVDSLQVGIDRDRDSLLSQAQRVGLPPPHAAATHTYAPVPYDAAQPGFSDRAALAGLSGPQQEYVYNQAMQRVRSLRTELESTARSIARETTRANKYRVEIHKKISIALACLIFMLIGAPLGLSVRRGGIGAGAAMALGIFLFYWVTLVQGEKLADRGLLTPWVGMWIANIVMTLVGLWLVVYVTLDLRATPPLRRRLRAWLRRARSS